jgi:hypothetical protein
MRKHPLVYEINTWVWLTELCKQYGPLITLENVPDEALADVFTLGFDAVWMMGVWERSPAGRGVALTHPGLQSDYDRAFPGWHADTVVGSPYAVRRYTVDARLGGNEGLAIFRAQLQRRGVGLLLDYVPNHVAVDHPWTVEHPEYFINGTQAHLKQQPDYFYQAGYGAKAGKILAHGRDPYFPAWTDTAQVNAFSPAFRQQTVATLSDIARQCDGVRCDMAMLLVTRIFAQTWGTLAGSAPNAEFWQEVIPAIREKSPQFIFMAEVYWDMEAELQAHGFDFTYDKRLYDRLHREPPYAVRDHLLASLDYQGRMVRFVENHDEARAVTTFGERGSKAAALISAALPGMKLFHEGQLEGRAVKLPVQLGDRQAEPVNARLRHFYVRLLTALREPVFHDGVYMPLGVNPILGEDRSHEAIIAFAWATDDAKWIVVVNLSDQEAKGRIMLPMQSLAGAQRWQFVDALVSHPMLTLAGDDVLNLGLALTLAPHQCALFRLEAFDAS